MTPKELKALEKLTVAQISAKLSTFVADPPVWQMLKTMDTFKRDELEVTYEDKVKGFSYHAVPESLIEDEEWNDAFAGKGKTFTIKGNGPLVTVGIAVALRDWTPDTANGQTGRPITKGDFKRFAIAG